MIQTHMLNKTQLARHDKLNEIFKDLRPLLEDVDMLKDRIPDKHFIPTNPIVNLGWYQPNNPPTQENLSQLEKLWHETKPFYLEYELIISDAIKSIKYDKIEDLVKKFYATNTTRTLRLIEALRHAHRWGRLIPSVPRKLLIG